MAVITYPSWAYHETQAAQVVADAAAFAALGSGWRLSPPFPPTAAIAPSDPGFLNTDIRLQQILIELRVLNFMSKQAFNNAEDPDNTGLRDEILSLDGSVST